MYRGCRRLNSEKPEPLMNREDPSRKLHWRRLTEYRGCRNVPSTMKTELRDIGRVHQLFKFRRRSNTARESSSDRAPEFQIRRRKDQHIQFHFDKKFFGYFLSKKVAPHGVLALRFDKFFGHFLPKKVTLHGVESIRFDKFSEHFLSKKVAPHGV